MKKYPVTPARNSSCLCGSGKKYKKCCKDIYKENRSLQLAHDAYNKKDYSNALIRCRANITQYSIWHKSHTEPLIQIDNASSIPILDIDIKAMSEIVRFLFDCYIKNEIVQDFSAVLERLRSNIQDIRWQRKITYFQALHAMWPNWCEQKGRNELNKLVPMDEEEDVEILQLYLDLFNDELSFSVKIELIDRIFQYSENPIDHLHYHGVKAILYLLIEDFQTAEKELEVAISKINKSEVKELSIYAKDRYAMTLGLLGKWKNDKSLINESLTLYEELLKSDDLTREGASFIYRSYADTLLDIGFIEKAIIAYGNAFEIKSDQICKVLQAQCYCMIEKFQDAMNLLNLISPKELNSHEYLDYIFAFSTTAICTGDNDLLNQAEIMLKEEKSVEAFFHKRVSKLLVQVLDMKSKGKSGSLMKKTWEIVKSVTGVANKYMIIQPNVMGIGLNVNKIFDSFTKGSETHSKK